jgi:hypothetical protein
MPDYLCNIDGVVKTPISCVVAFLLMLDILKYAFASAKPQLLGVYAYLCLEVLT